MSRHHAGLGTVLLLGAFLMGCSSMDAQPTAVTDVGANKTFMSAAADVGPEGGILSCGPYTLEIPAGALSYTAHITMAQEAANQWPVTLGPDGTQFAVPATLTFNLAGEANPAAMQVAWWNPSTSGWVPQATKHNADLAVSEISHFSRWVVQ